LNLTLCRSWRLHPTLLRRRLHLTRSRRRLDPTLLRRRLDLALLGWRLDLALLGRRWCLPPGRLLLLRLGSGRRLARPLRRFLLLFALRRRLRHDDGRVERRGDGPQDEGREQALFCVRHQIPILVGLLGAKRFQLDREGAG
jgi:hypothetical protein